MEDTFHLGLKALIQNKDGEILILKANLKTFKSPTEEHWDLPGGRIQKGENPETALRREVREEIGVEHLEILELFDASVSKMRLSYIDTGLILFTYLCKIPDDKDIELTDNEHTEFRWVKPQEAAKLLSTKFADSLLEKVKNL